MLSFLIKIYEPIIIIANCNLTVLISRWYFCEPNKLGFTILGRLHNLLSFIKVQRITKLNKHFYFTGNQGNRILTCGPTAAARPSSASAGAAQRGSERVAQQAAAGVAAAGRPSAARRAGGLAGGSGPARQGAGARQRRAWPSGQRDPASARCARAAAASSGSGPAGRTQAGRGRKQRGPASGSGRQAGPARLQARETGPEAYFNVLRLYFPT